MSGEKRIARRKLLSYPARIDAGDGKPLVECVLADISETGARVILHEPAEIPERCTLLLGTQGAAPRHCRLVWHEGDEVGLEFKKDMKSAKPPLLRSRSTR